MGRLALVAVLAATACVPLLAACGAANDESFPAGTYTSQSETAGYGMAEFRDDGTWTVSAGATAATAQASSSGTYSIDGTTLTFETDTFCKVEGAEKGTYTWKQADGTLTLTVESDGCAQRIGVVTGRDWVRKT